MASPFSVLAGLGRASVLVEGAGMLARSVRGGYEARDRGVSGVLAGAAREALRPVTEAVPVLGAAFDTGPGTVMPNTNAFDPHATEAQGLPSWALQNPSATGAPGVRPPSKKKGALGRLADKIRTRGSSPKRQRSLQAAQQAQEAAAPTAQARQLRAMRERTAGLQQTARSRQGQEQREVMDPEVRAKPDGLRAKLREIALRRRLRELTVQLQEQAAAAAEPDQAAQLEAMALAAAEQAAQQAPAAAVDAAPADSAIGQWVRSLVASLMTRPTARVADALAQGQTPQPNPEADFDPEALLSEIEEDASLAGCPCGGLDEACGDGGGDDLEAVGVPLLYREPAPIAGAPPAEDSATEVPQEFDVFGLPIATPEPAALAGDDAGDVLSLFGPATEDDAATHAGAVDAPEVDVFGLPIAATETPGATELAGDDAAGEGWAALWNTAPAGPGPFRVRNPAPPKRGGCGTRSCTVRR